MPADEIQDLPSGPEYHDDKQVLGSWVHRRPATRVSPPSVTQHLAFWLPDNLTTSRIDWVKNIDAFLVHLKQHLKDKSIENTAREFLPLSAEPERRYQAVQLTFEWQAMPVDLNIELHHEYFTLTNTIDLAHVNLRSFSKATNAAASKLNKALRVINRVAQNRYNAIKEGKNPKVAEHQSKFGGSYQAIYTEIWDAFFNDVLAAPLANRRNEKSVGKALVDFRGLIINRPENAVDSQFISPPGNVEKVRRDKMGPTFEPGESIHLAHTILPFMTSGVSGQEHTVSRLLGGKCIYATAMGTQPPELGGNGGPNTTYVILAATGDRNELGRLVDRLHTLGTTRIAALYDLTKLTRAGDALHSLEQGAIESLGKRDQEVMSGPVNEESAREFALEIASLSSSLQAIKEMVPDGLPYRVERSRYYQRQFNDLVTSLRISENGRVEGFQPYDEFVKRRLGNSYNFIDMIGIRYDRLRNTTSELNQQLRAVEAVNLVGGIEKFQRGAEIGFFTFPFAYYGTHVAEFILDKGYLEEHPKVLKGITLGLLGMGTAIATRDEIHAAFKSGAAEVVKRKKEFSRALTIEKAYWGGCYQLTKEQISEITGEHIGKITRPLKKLAVFRKRNRSDPK